MFSEKITDIIVKLLSRIHPKYINLFSGIGFKID